jgi:hypothetical protein
MQGVETFIVFVPLVLLVVLFWPLSSLSRGQDRHARQLSVIDRRMRLIMDHLGIAEPVHPMPEVVRHLEAGRKILAIKAYRAVTGADVKASKQAVEELAAQRGLAG